MANLEPMPEGPPANAPDSPVNWPFSVVILTLNEERNLPLCLASLGGCDDIVVLDSGSRDRTVALAEAAGARTFTRRFDNFALQRNFAQREISFRHSWVFHLDADECFTPALAADCARAVSSPQSAALDGYFVAPRMIFEGRWIPHCTDYPAWQARFVRAPQFEFIEVGHGQREASAMRLGRLGASYLHDLSAGGEAEWLEKHRRYARAEALSHRREPGGWRHLFSSSALIRRRALKQSTAAVPFRPAVRFLYQYLLRRGFLDGFAGLRYCRLLARYEGLIAEEKRRLRHAQKNPSL
jgi:glycosyltransferase involved in cell wall biosynthesis